MKNIRPVFSVLFILFLGYYISSCSSSAKKEPKVLVFSKTEGYHHESIAAGVKALIKMGGEKGFVVDTTTDSRKFNEDTLKQYATVIFLSTTGDVLDYIQQADFERYIQAGGGFVGVHAAADTEYDWPWYGKLVGAYFVSHPKQQEAVLHIHKNKYFPVTDSLPNPWKRFDEWYNYRNLTEGLHVLTTLDENSYEGGTMGDYHPNTWFHGYDGGRSFYTGLGHTDESYEEPNFLNLLYAGIKYAIGKNRPLDYNKAKTLRVPDENRFSKVILGRGLDEPTQLTVLPDLSILLTERKGGIKYFNVKDSSLTQVAHIPVYHHTLHTEGVNVEMGLLGIEADPHYGENHWIYIYYSPVDTSVDRLSRFQFKNGVFDLKSEQVILDVKTDREICCHTGGSIAFDADDNLYLSVGDNTTPFDEKDPTTGKTLPIALHGFSPIDDRPGFENYDDRRASGNTNDLRGKILRIHVNKDGSYSIPEGNLFPVGTPKTRPEIYAMGGRNLYRMSVDKHTGYVYWGDVGPDANNDSLETRGPKGYDEINQARKAGNFGWPLFVGNNYPYVEYDFNTGISGKPFDPEHPINDSRNNTGLRELPPAQPAFIWYPYGPSPDFPIVGSGGRTAMAGPVYYVNDYPKATRFPEYYNGKLFIYEWMRDWIMVVTMNKEGDLQTIEPFMPDTRFDHIIDMKPGPDGRLYFVEYGAGWFTENADASLSVITYNGGNRPPVARLKIEKDAGSLPFTADLDASGSIDPDGDNLSYEWDLGNGEKIKTSAPELTYTYKTAGAYHITVTVQDGKGGSTVTNMQTVYAGNNRPDVNIKIGDANPDIYFPGNSIDYDIVVNDQEDGNSADRGFDLSSVFVHWTYSNDFDKAGLQKSNGADLAEQNAASNLIATLDCMACHKINGESVGPAYIEVSKRYKDDAGAVGKLADKIIQGGSGNWGERVMPPHSKLTKPDAETIAKWILSLDTQGRGESMPLKGSFTPGTKGTEDVVLSASYTDKGANNVPPLTGEARYVLKSPVLSIRNAQNSTDVSEGKQGDTYYRLVGKDQGWVSFQDVNLTGVSGVKINYYLLNDLPKGWNVSVHLDSAEGDLLGETTVGQGQPLTAPLERQVVFNKTQSGKHDLFVVLRKNESGSDGSIALIGTELLAR